MSSFRKQKKLALCVAALFASMSQLAKADIGFTKNGVDVDLYGVVDIGIGSLEHSYGGSPIFASTVNPYNLNSSPSSFNGVFSGGISMSRWGIKANVDLGSGRKAFVKLESAIDVTSGQTSNNGQSVFNAINPAAALNTKVKVAPLSANGASAIDGQLFSRAAYAGMSDSKLGSLAIGRTTNFSLDQVAEYDPVQNALLFSPLGFSGGIGGGLGATENTRLDNSFKYENKISNVDFGLQYKFAGSQSDQSASSGYVAMLGYNTGPFSLKGTFSGTHNTVAWATQYSNVVSPNSYLQIENTHGYMLSGMYKISPEATAKMGYEHTALTSPSNTSLTSIVNYYGITLPTLAQNATVEQDFGTFWIGGDYKFTQNFDLAVGYYNINTHNSPEINKQYIDQAYSILADYSWNKSFDTYAAAMLSSYSGAGLTYYPTMKIYSSNAMYGVGLRFKF